MFLLFLLVAQLGAICLGETEIYAEIFYVNLNRSNDRRLSMEQNFNSLNLSYQRIEAVDAKFMTSDLNKASTSSANKEEMKALVFPANFLQYKSIQLNHVFISSGNTLKQIACTLSHLVAIITALQSPSKAPYALIMEDDMHLAFDIDFKKFGAIFPRDFGIIQMTTSNPLRFETLLQEYLRSGVLYKSRKESDLWSTGGYLVNKAVLREQMKGVLAAQDPESDVFQMDLIAGTDRQGCAPASCCVNGTFIHQFPCVLSDHGVQADEYLYHIAHGGTFVTTIPLFHVNETNEESTVGDSTIELFKKAAHRINEIVKNESLPHPSYIVKSFV